MSSVAITGNAAGAGVFTIASPNSASSFTATLPTATTTLVGTDATQTLTNKTLTSPTLTTPVINSATFATVSGTASLYGCRAWVNFNGTGTVAIRASGNVSSITDNGAGNYSVNFATAMPDADYAPVISVEESGITCFCAFNNTVQQTAGVGRIGVFVGTGSSPYDAEQVNYVVLR